MCNKWLPMFVGRVNIAYGESGCGLDAYVDIGHVESGCRLGACADIAHVEPGCHLGDCVDIAHAESRCRLDASVDIALAGIRRVCIVFGAVDVANVAFKDFHIDCFS